MLIWFALFSGLAVAEVSHHPSKGNQASDEEADAFVYTTNASQDRVIQQPPRSPSKGGGDEDTSVKTAKGADKQVIMDLGPGHFPVYIFADGPSPREKTPPSYWQYTDQMMELVRTKVSGAKLISLRPLSVAKLATAWKDFEKRSVAHASQVNSVIVILNAEVPADRFAPFTTEGFVEEEKFRDTLLALQKTLGEHPKVETVLLTGRAGDIQCPKFPGPVFGMSPAGRARELSALELWLQHQKWRPEMFFPMSAREVYDDWGITNHITRNQYFYCPFRNFKGYLGFQSIPTNPPEPE